MTVVSAIGSLISVSAIVTGSTFTRQLLPLQATRHALRIDFDAVGLRIRRLHGHQIDGTACRVQPAYLIFVAG